MNFTTKEEQWIIQLCSFVYLCHHFGVTLIDVPCAVGSNRRTLEREERWRRGRREG